jgi:lipoprotein-releasing system permease protein
VTGTLAEVRTHKQVVGAAPFIATQALLARGEDMKGTMVRGIDPAHEPEVTDLALELKNTGLQRLIPGEFGVVLGGELARSLGVREGDTRSRWWLRAARSRPPGWCRA